MGEIATSNRLITLYYNSDSIRAKKTLAYAKAEGVPVQEIDILKTPFTGTQLLEIAERLNLEVQNLVNTDHPAFTKVYKKTNLSPDDWIKLIQNHPEIMKQPIALRGKNTVLIETPTDILKL